MQFSKVFYLPLLEYSTQTGIATKLLSVGISLLDAHPKAGFTCLQTDTIFLFAVKLLCMNLSISAFMVKVFCSGLHTRVLYVNFSDCIVIRVCINYAHWKLEQQLLNSGTGHVFATPICCKVTFKWLCSKFIIVVAHH